MKTLILLVALLAAMVCHPAFAESQAHQAAAVRYANAMPLTDVIDDMLPFYLQQVPVRERLRVANEVRTRFDHARLMATYVEILMSIYSAEELDALAAFYSSPIGVSIQSKRWQLSDNHWRFREEVERAVKQTQAELASALAK